MSSILDAVTKDASRSGTIPGETGPSAPSGRSGSGGGPGRFRTAALVVVFGVAMGAVAARMFGGGEGEPDDMLTEKSTGRSAVAAAPVAAGGEPATSRPRKKDLAGAKPAAPAMAQPVTKEPAVVAAAPAVPPTPAPLVIPAPAPSPGVAAPPVPVSRPPAAVPPPAVAIAPKAPPAPPPATVAAAPAIPPASAESPALPAAAPTATPPASPVVLPPAAVVAAKPAAPAGPFASSPPAPKAPAPVVPLPAPLAKAPAVVAGSSPPTTLVPGENLAAPEDPGSVDAPAAPPTAAEVVLEERPAGAPEVYILFVAWSKKPASRMASMRIGTGSLSVVHEGEYVEGLQVTGIHPESVVFRWTGQKFRVPVRPF